jgi:hypothetical protein
MTDLAVLEVDDRTYGHHNEGVWGYCSVELQLRRPQEHPTDLECDAHLGVGGGEWYGEVGVTVLWSFFMAA